MVFFIALALALPVIGVGVIFRNAKAVIFAAMIMGGVGLASGNPYFAGADIVGVIIGTLIAMQFCESKQSAPVIRIQDSVRPINNVSPRTYNPPTIPNRGNDANIVSNEELDLLSRHLSFYEDLELGIRKPDSDAQHHFLEVIRGRVAPRTKHEIAFWNHMKRRK
jgi:hypothetical protein